MVAMAVVTVMAPLGATPAPAGAEVQAQSVGPAIPFSEPQPGDTGLVAVDLEPLRAASSTAKTMSGARGWVVPAHGPLTSPFGYRWGRLHAGLDIDGNTGDLVMAAAKGVVIEAGWSGGYGREITVDHGGGLVSSYAHLSRIDVSVGQKVVAGEPIGRMGNTGNSRGSHLHFEIRRHDVPLDPGSFLYRT